jgi:ribosomal protein S18 acetylase RimI-like enzyme
MSFTITVLPLTSKRKAWIYHALSRHAIDVMGFDGLAEQPIPFVIRDDGQDIGVCVVQYFWGNLHIKYLVTHESYRGLGIDPMKLRMRFFCFALCPMIGAQKILHRNGYARFFRLDPGIDIFAEIPSFSISLGLARQLMEHALNFGKNRGCAFAFVETLSFQSPVFYQKLGFDIELKRDGYAGGASFYYLRKDL